MDYGIILFIYIKFEDKWIQENNERQRASSWRYSSAAAPRRLTQLRRQPPERARGALRPKFERLARLKLG